MLTGHLPAPGRYWTGEPGQLHLLSAQSEGRRSALRKGVHYANTIVYVIVPSQPLLTQVLWQYFAHLFPLLCHCTPLRERDEIYTCQLLKITDPSKNNNFCWNTWQVGSSNNWFTTWGASKWAITNEIGDVCAFYFCLVCSSVFLVFGSLSLTNMFT